MKLDFPSLKKPQEGVDLTDYLKDYQQKTCLLVSSPVVISKNNLFQMQRRIPSPWKESLPSTHPNFPREKIEKETPKCSPKHPIHWLIGSIRFLSMQGHLSEAFKSFYLLQLQSSSSVAFLHPISSLLSASTNLRALPQGKQLHAHIISLGLHGNPFLISRLSSFYSTVGLFSDAKIIVENSSTEQTLAWNLLISAYIRNGCWLDVVLAYKKMVEWRIMVDKFTYPSVLRACSEILDLELGRMIHGSIEISGLQHDLFISNALISMYAKCGMIEVARQLFDCMSRRDIVTWNSLISGYVSNGMWNESLELLEKMQLEESKMNTVTWNIIATANSQMGSHSEALELISKVRIRDSSIDPASLVIGLNSCSRTGHLRLGKEIHCLAFRLHYNGLDNVSNALITMYSRCKQIEVSYHLFRMRTYKSLVTWNAMIAGFAGGDQEEETFLTLQEMIRSQIQPNYVTLMTVLPLCARTANLRYGQELHCYIIKHTFENYQLLCNSLIDMYSKSGSILVAQRVFDTMSDHDRVSYTSMIAGYGMQGEGVKALDLFYKMTYCGIKPDGITMVAILSACSHSGLITTGEMLFRNMKVLYGIAPQMEHFSCMVDLFARAGFLRDAEEFIDRMLFEPSTAILATLVRACRAYGNTEIGERAAKRLLDMRSDEPTHYALVVDTFTYCKNWVGLTRVRAVMKDLGITELYMLLGGLYEHMQDVGYVGDKGLVILAEVFCEQTMKPE